MDQGLRCSRRRLELRFWGFCVLASVTKVGGGGLELGGRRVAVYYEVSPGEVRRLLPESELFLLRGRVQ
ncbi:hypothetical protein ABZP36_021927 [Zizania latifolia]